MPEYKSFALKTLKRIVQKSNLFDQHYYLKCHQDVRLANITPLEHYCRFGINEDRKPNPDFDPVWYREYYMDVKGDGAFPIVHYALFGRKENRFVNASEKQEYNTIKASGRFDAIYYKNSYEDLKNQGNDFDFLLHYIRHGRKEGRKPNAQSADNACGMRNLSSIPPWPEKPLTATSAIDESIKGDYSVISDSGLFDSSYYIKTYPDVAASGISPLEHFCLYGWKEKRNPSESFSTHFYVDKYPDVAASAMNPFVHWLKYGRGENRKINVINVNTHAADTQNNPSIIFISHEASQTGAPAVLLSLMRWIKNNTNLNFAIIVGSQGPWNNRFEELAPCFYMDGYHHHQLEDELRNFCGNNVQAIYVNTIASGLYAEHLRFLNAEFITHVHEMENVFKIFEPHFNVLRKLSNKYIAVSQGSVEAIKRRVDAGEADILFLKPFIEPRPEPLSVIPKLTKKNVIFGCGAVELRKGFDLFCEVGEILISQGLTDFKMYWIGTAENKDLDPRTEIEKRNLGDFVEWLGPKENPRDYFTWGDIFLLPSREDPYPLVCMEAADCGMPVICFDEQAGGMHSFVEDDAGMVVSYLDTKAMASAAHTLLSNQALRKEMGGRALEKVKERHYVDAIAPQIVAALPPIVTNVVGSNLELYKQLIDDSKIVSFDIFDTLVTRKLHDPNVVFDVIEYKHTHNESAPLPLFKERMESAGKVLSSYGGAVDDISIDEIYHNMAFYKDREIEKQTEIQMCVPHPMGIKLYRYARDRGKKIYIASDMYLDQSTIEEILRKNGINQWEELFLSSALGKKKDTGRLYSHLLDYAKKDSAAPNDILHIGDNWEGDIRKARAAGLKAVRFTPLYEKKHKLFPLGAQTKQQLSQIGRIWDSFCTQATNLWHESNPGLAADFYTKLGFELTGPLAAMMAMHARAQAEQAGIRKIVFMARDGRIIKKAFDTFYSDDITLGRFESCYLHLSRATVIPATFGHPLSSNDIYFLIEGLHLSQKPVSYFLEKAGLDRNAKDVERVVKHFFASADTVPVWADLNKLAEMFGQLSEQIHDCNQVNRDALKAYLEQTGVLSEQKVLVVDVGWLLNIQSRLDKFIKSIEGSTSVIGCYVGSRDRINKSLAHSSLLFDCGDPHRYAQFIEDNTTLFEVLFSAPEPSARGLEFDTEKLRARVAFKNLGMPLPPEFTIAQKLQMGAEAFFEHLKAAKTEFFPEQISKDYFFHIFEALTATDNDLAKAHLGHFEVRLGGHHEFVAHQRLVGNETPFEYRLKIPQEYFEPMLFEAEPAVQRTVIVTSAGLDNGSTRYRALNLAESLSCQGITSHVIHAATSREKAERLIETADVVIFQRCFEEQGNVAAMLQFARKLGTRCLAEMDDLVFPEYIPSVGSVKGGEWNQAQAMFVATSYENLIRKVDGCIVSTPLLKEHIESRYHSPATVIRNKISSSLIREPLHKSHSPLQLIYASGTYSHKEDVALIEQVLFEFLEQHASARLSILGAAQVSERLLALPNVSNYPLLDYEAMLAFIAKHHLMLVPLSNDMFNRAKSSVKFVEAGAVGVPVLASRVGEFEYVIDHQDNGLLADNSTDWLNILEWAASNPSRLAELGIKASDTVKQRYVTSSTLSTTEENVKGILGHG